MTKRQKRGCILVLAGLIMVLSALGLHQAEARKDALAGENAQILLQQLELSKVSLDIPSLQQPEETHPVEQTPPDASPEPEAERMPEKEFLGYSMIGTLRVPSVDIELPVLRDWSYDLLNVAPCRYSGSAPGGDMILMGHNYRSHFTPLHSVAVGAEVEFEDVNGIVYRYEVAQIQYLHKSEGELLPSDYPLTLFTCTAGGQNRIVVRCVGIDEP